MRTADGSDALTWVDEEARNITQSQMTILEAAQCDPDTPALPHAENHHDLVAAAVAHVVEETKTSTTGGQLGARTGARFRVYQRLFAYAEAAKGTLFESEELLRAIDDIYRYPLRQQAADTLNRQLRTGVRDAELVRLVLALRDGDQLTISHEDAERREPQIICSLGLRITAK